MRTRTTSHSRVVNQLTPVEDDSSAISEFKCTCTVVSALKKKWSLQEINVKQLSVLSTALDPRFKNVKFLNDNQRGSVEGKVVGMATRVGVEITLSPPKRDKKSTFDELLYRRHRQGWGQLKL